MNTEETEKNTVVKNLMDELSEGEKSGQEKGWINISDVEKMLGLKKF